MVPALIANAVNSEPNAHVPITIALFFSSTMVADYFSRKISMNINYVAPLHVFFYISVTTVAITAIAYSFNSIAVVISDIYGARGSMRETVPFPGAERVYAFACRFGLVYFMCYSIIQRKNLLLLTSVVISLSFFLIGAHKSILALTILSTFFAFFVMRASKINLLASAIILTICCTVFFEKLIGIYLLTDLVVRRVIILPSYLTYNYIDMFLFDPNLFRSTPLDKSDVAFHVGEVFFNRKNMRCNVNIIASSVTSLGYFSVLFTGIIFGTMSGILGKSVERINMKKTKSIVYAIICCYSWSLTESSFSVVLFTHGLIILYIPLIMSLLKKGSLL